MESSPEKSFFSISYLMSTCMEQVKTDASAIHAAPVTTPVGRPDEVTAARKPIVKYEEE